MPDPSDAVPEGSEGPEGPGTSGRGGRQARVTLVGRPRCHLCDVARSVIEQVCAELDVGWTEVSIDDDPVLRERYAEMIPVTLLDGRQHDYWRVDPIRLRSALGAG